MSTAPTLIGEEVKPPKLWIGPYKWRSPERSLIGGGAGSWDWPRGATAAIDLLHPDEQPSAGSDRSVGVFATPNEIGLSSAYELLCVGDPRDCTVGPRIRSLWLSFTGRDIQAANVLDLIERDLTEFPNPLMPDSDRLIHLAIGRHYLSRRVKIDDQGPRVRKHNDLIRRELRKIYREIRDVDEELADEFFDHQLEKYYRLKRHEQRVQAWRDGRGADFRPVDARDRPPRKHATTITETFNGSDQAAIGHDYTFTEGHSPGGWDNYNNHGRKLYYNSAGASQPDHRYARPNIALSTVDHSAEVTISVLAGTSVQNQSGCWTRLTISGVDGYATLVTAEGYQYLYKSISNTWTEIGSKQSISFSLPDTAKLEANGSFLKSWFNGSLCHEVIDLSITTGTYGGAHGLRAAGQSGNSNEIDQLVLEDVTAHSRVIVPLTAVTKYGAGTTASFDTTDADLIVVSIGHWGDYTGSVSDNQSNTYTHTGKHIYGSNSQVTMHHCLSPTTSTTHTVTTSSLGSWPSFSVVCYEGPDAYQEETGSAAANTYSLSVGSLTPDSGITEALHLYAWCQYNQDVIPSGSFNPWTKIPFWGANAMGSGIGHFIQEGEDAQNPAVKSSVHVGAFTQVAGIHAVFTYTAAAGENASATEGFEFADSATAKVGGKASISDGFELGESESGAAAVQAAAIDGVAIGESIAGVKGLGAAVTDGFVFGEDSAVAQAAQAAGADGFKIGESVACAKALVAAATDGIEVGVSIACSFGKTAQAADGITFGESLTCSTGLTAQAADGVRMGSEAERFAEISVSSAEGFTLGELSLTSIAVAVSAADGVLTGESVLPSAGFPVSITDGVVIGEADNAAARLKVVAADGALIGGGTAIIIGVHLTSICLSAFDAPHVYFAEFGAFPHAMELEALPHVIEEFDAVPHFMEEFVAAASYIEEFQSCEC